MTHTNARHLNGTWAHLAHAGYALLLIILIGLMVVGLPALLAEQSRGYIHASLAQNAQGEVVLTPIAGGEAALAGVQAGDVLLAINGAPVPAGTSVEQAAEMLRGKVGEAVTFTVRGADGSEKAYTIVRSEQYLEALASVGLEPAAVTALAVGIEIALTVVVIALSLWIFLKHQEDWLMLLAAAILALLPSGMGVVNLPFSGAQRLGLLPLYEFVRSLALGLSVLFLFVFPNGKFFPRWTKGIAIAAGVYALLFWVYTFFPKYFLPFSPETWLWLAFSLLGVYAQVRRYIQDSTPGEKKQTLWLLYGTIAVIAVYILMFIYNQLPGALFSWGQWIILDLARNAVAAATLVFFAFSLVRSLRNEDPKGLADL